MNIGVPGTGISLIFYTLLAVLMPIIHCGRFLRNRREHDVKFVFVHFTYAVYFIFILLIEMSILASSLSVLNVRGPWTTMMRLGALGTFCMLASWITLPLFARYYASLRRRRKGLHSTLPYLAGRKDVQVIDGIYI